MSERVEYIEIDLPACPLTYGQAPCTAAIGVTGSIKCFNTRATCQDLTAYASNEDKQTIRFGYSTLALSADIVAIPNISSVSYNPSRLMLGESIGARSTITVQFSDHPFPDTGPGGDKYIADRNYIPYHQGTFWGKFRARNRFLRGKEMRWYQGQAGDTLDSMEARTFVVDRIEGPDSTGRMTVIAKDPLTLIDDKRAQAPRLSPGVLSADIGAGTTSFTLSPAGVGNAAYSASGFIAIGGEEVCSFTRVNDVMTIVRGLRGTEAIEHDEDDRVQLCLVYDTDPVDEILYDLITTYSDVSADYIIPGNWASEAQEWLGTVHSALIAEPTPVVDLVNELLLQTSSTIWWNEIAATIQFQVLRNVSPGSPLYTDDVMLEGSFTQRDQPNKRVSQVWTYFAQINPLEPQGDPTNYRSSLLTVNFESEERYGTPSIKRIFSRWINQFGFVNVERLNELILSRYSEPPRMYTYRLLRDSGVPTPALGSGARIESFFAQDETGASKIEPGQIVQLNGGVGAWSVMMEELTPAALEAPVGVRRLVIEQSVDFGYNIRAAHDSIYQEPVSGIDVIVEIRGGVNVGSPNTSSYALRTGSWPSGVNLSIIIFSNAVIAGKGAIGGDVSLSGDVLTNGQVGGPALLAEVPVTITNDGIIGGGGGGGGAAWFFHRMDPGTFGTQYSSQGIGGSGGAGKVAGQGGSKNESMTISFDTTSTTKGNISGLLTGGASITQTFGISPAISTATSGAGGNLGQPGNNGSASTTSTQPESETKSTNGGAAGIAVQGDSLVTWTTLGDIRGSRVG